MRRMMMVLLVVLAMIAVAVATIETRYAYSDSGMVRVNRWTGTREVWRCYEPVSYFLKPREAFAHSIDYYSPSNLATVEVPLDRCKWLAEMPK